MTIDNDVPELLIVGARTQLGQGWANNEHRLVALDKMTRQPIEVNWSYEDSPEDIVTAVAFTDTRPDQRLLANSSKYIRGSLINKSNIGGNASSFAAIMDNGKVVAWGFNGEAGITPTSTFNHDVIKVYGGIEITSIGINNEKKIFSWSKTSNDSIPLEISALNDIVVAKTFNSYGYNTRVFLALRENKQIVQWEDGNWPWPLPLNIAEMKDIVAIEASDGAFAAIKENGHLIASGDPAYGGELPAHLQDVSDACAIFANNKAFVSLHQSGKVSAWGDENHGGTLPSDIAILNDIISVHPYYHGFVALRENHSIVEWGSTENDYMKIPPEISSKTDILDVQIALNGSGAILLPEGKVAHWGATKDNSHYIPLPDNVDNVVSLCAAPDAFAVIKRDGTVIAWGHPDQGGNISPVADELYNIRAIYSSTYGFCAIRDDGQIITWGDNEREVNVYAIPPELQNNLTYAW
ncbi:hypothetical protein VU573_17725 [Enterobacter kobei]|uniref:hypothetical protein n=1 Tax=Enterobacter kobei TaxID=208224 RepID=UPI002A815CE9|nr:hypothetical protein [Enterobacter kobei]